MEEPTTPVTPQRAEEGGIKILLGSNEMNKETIINTHAIWIPKAIGFIAIHPFYDFMGQILLDLFYTIFWDSTPKSKEELGPLVLMNQR